MPGPAVRPGEKRRYGQLVVVAVIACLLLAAYLLLRVGPTRLAGSVGIG